MGKAQTVSFALEDDALHRLDEEAAALGGTLSRGQVARLLVLRALGDADRRELRETVVELRREVVELHDDVSDLLAGVSLLLKGSVPGDPR